MVILRDHFWAIISGVIFLLNKSCGAWGRFFLKGWKKIGGKHPGIIPFYMSIYVYFRFLRAPHGQEHNMKKGVSIIGSGEEGLKSSVWSLVLCYALWNGLGWPRPLRLSWHLCPFFIEPYCIYFKAFLSGVRTRPSLVPRRLKWIYLPVTDQ